MELTIRETEKTLDPEKALLARAMGDVEEYCQAVQRLPLLSAEEEQQLARRLRREGDLEAARRLVLSHLRFVVRIARGYGGYGLPLADLIQEGNIGLMKAVKRFDPEQGVRLVSFAVHWIRAEIHEFILRNWRIVKVATTKAQRKLFFNLRRAKRRLGWLEGPEVRGVAQALGVSPAQVQEMETRLSAQDLSFDGRGAEEEEEPGRAPVTYLADRRADPAGQLERWDQEDHDGECLHRALASLDRRSQQIITRRWLQEDKSTLHELAAEYRVSAERIRQVEHSALQKLRRLLADEPRRSENGLADEKGRP